MSDRLQVHFNAFGPRVPSDFREQLFPITCGRNLSETPGSPMKMASMVKEAPNVGLVTHFKPEGEICTDVEMKSKVVGQDGVFHMAMQLAGGAVASVEEVKGSHTLYPGQALMFTGEDQIMNGFLLSCASFETVTLSLSGGFLLRALEPDTAPKTFRKILSSGQFSTPYLSKLNTTPMAQRLSLEMVSNPYRGAFEELYLQGKVLELLAEILTTESNREKGRNETRQAHWGKVLDARDILLNNPENPPSAMELSNMVGMSYKTLNRGFLKYFQMTINQFAMGAMLDYARKTLAETDLTVVEVAHKCGYANSSSFIAAYRRRFGQSPGHIRRGEN
ncbi:MAG: AraC family transcriptional regulator [Nitrospinota bacterium]|nr:AraC family transcriptional regulator [Nitrospinota bacterium]